MKATGGTGGIPAGFEVNLGDVNGDGVGKKLGNVVKVKHPAVRQVGGAGQDRLELFTTNDRGQVTTQTDPEGNLTVYLRYPENDPEGDGRFIAPTLSGQQYGRVREVHVDADPDDVMSLVGTAGDLTTFTGNLITRTNTPGSYLDLVSRYEGTGGCGSCAYDALGNPLTATDPRGFTTTTDRNEMGEAYRVTSPAPYNFRVETHYDANRNVTRVDTEDKQVAFLSDDPTDADYAKVSLSGNANAGVAHVGMKAGPGGSVRAGWFTNLSAYDLLDNKTVEDVDATGSDPSSLITRFEYDPNQNLIRLTKPEGNTVEYDYDERNIRIATRVGYDPATSQPGAVTVTAFDGNGNVVDVVGPADRGGAGTRLSVVIDDAFRSGAPMTHVGDWAVENTYDGFDRANLSTDAVGDTGEVTYDPDGRAVQTLRRGLIGGATPTDRTGAGNVDLDRRYARFDEAGRLYEDQADVFLASGVTLPSGRAVTHEGGGLAANTLANNHTATATLTSGQTSYVLVRALYDRAGRVTTTEGDNVAVASYTFDGTGRVLLTVAPFLAVATTYDGNGNAVAATRTEVESGSHVAYSPGVTAAVFTSSMRYDCLNRPTVSIDPGPTAQPADVLASYVGYDSRGNATLSVDPKANTVVTVFDGASRATEVHQHLRVGGLGENPPAAKGSFEAQGRAVIRTKTVYDGNGRTAQLVDDRGAATSYAYDSLDRQMTLTFVDGSTRTSGYNGASDMVSYTDENGSAFASTFDPLGRRTAVAITRAADVVGTTAQAFEYDGLSRRTLARDSVGAADADALFFYDSLGRVLEESQSYDGNTRNVTHTAYHSYATVEHTYPDGTALDITRDALYRLAAFSGIGSCDWRFVGPSRVAEQVLGNGLFGTMLNNARTASTVQPAVPNSAWGTQSSDRLGYDGTGRLTTKRYLAGGVDPVTNGYANTTAVVGFTTEYDPADNKQYERHLHATGRSHLYSAYDSVGRLLAYHRGTLATGGGSVASPIALPGTDTERSYDLDGLGNWKRAVYTPVGGSPATQVRQHNYVNQLTRVGSGSVGYDHGDNAASPDPIVQRRGNGNIATVTFATLLELSYDALNRLAAASSDHTPVAVYTYDAIGRRVRKVVTNGGVPGDVSLNGTTDFVYDGARVVEERDGSSAAVRQYAWGQYVDELVVMKTLATTGGGSLPAGTYYPLTDLLYRSVALADSSGSIVEVYDTDVYGNTLCYKAAGTGGNWFADDAVTTDNPACRYVFTGREFDAETQLYCYRARNYCSQLGRFLSLDPIGYLRGLNAYEFVMSSPSNGTDPLGLEPSRKETYVDYITKWEKDRPWLNREQRIWAEAMLAKGCIGVTIINLGRCFKDSKDGNNFLHPDMNNCYATLEDAEKLRRLLDENCGCGDFPTKIFSIHFWSAGGSFEPDGSGRVNMTPWIEAGVKDSDVWYRPAEDGQIRDETGNMDFGFLEDESGMWLDANTAHRPTSPMVVKRKTLKEWRKLPWDYDKEVFCVACAGGEYKYVIKKPAPLYPLLPAPPATQGSSTTKPKR